MKDRERERMTTQKKPNSYARISLLIAFAGVLATLPFRHTFWGNLGFSGFEAGLVGGLADWFAVTALFRHPFGQAWIPHTAIIPNNKPQIIRAIEDVVLNEWFQIDSLVERLNRFSPSAYVIEMWEKDEKLQNQITKALTQLSGKLLDALPLSMAVDQIDAWLRSYTSKLKLTPMLAECVQWAIQKGYDDRIADFLLGEAIQWVRTPQFSELIVPMLEKVGETLINASPLGKFGMWALDRFELLNYQEVAATVQERFEMELIHAKEQHDHPLRKRILALFPLAAEQFKTNGNLQVTVEEWKEKTIAKIQIKEPLLQTLESFKGVAGFFLQGFVVKLFQEEVASFRSDLSKQAAVDQWIRDKAVRLLREKHHWIGKLVRENLEKLDDENFVETIETKVGNDLQWIRVNGAVVGTIVGLLLFLIISGLKFIPGFPFV